MKVTLKAARVNVGLSQEDVATALNVSKASVSAWENGKFEPKMSHFKALCELYNADAGDIILSTT